jgi:hypothetical protein
MFKLRISFGGLCLFVQKTTGINPGLYVLLPKTGGMPGMVKHCPTLIYQGVAGREYRPLTRSENYLDMAPAGSPSPHPCEIMEMSKYAGAAVNSGCFDGSNQNVAFSFVFPLGGTILPTGECAKFTVPAGKDKTEDRYFTSQADLVMDLPDLSGKGLSINGVALQPIDGALSLSIVNAPPDYFYGVRDAVVKNTKAEHLCAYYTLLDPTNPNPPVDILHAEAQVGVGVADPLRPCPGAKAHPALANEGESSAAIPFYGDPANCTVGWGCPQYPCP